MGRAIPYLIVVLFAFGAVAHADHDDVVGRYDLRGSGTKGAYAGTVRISKKRGRLLFALERSDGMVQTGELRRRGSRWLFRSDLRRVRGLARSLGVEAAAPLHVLRAVYTSNPRGLAGPWRLNQGRVVIDEGSEVLVRKDGAELPAVRVVVSVDWEGRAILSHNLRAMESLRAALPGVPLTHFLNAAYFTKPGADPAAIVARMKRVVLEGDERGLHLHGWRSLIDSAGVLFKSSPSYWGVNLPLRSVGGDMGHEVEIDAYSVSELRAILGRSKALLGEHGFAPGAAFRAGGWLATPKVLHAVRAAGFTIDSSSTDSTWHDELRGRRLHRRIAEVWPGVTRYSQPFTIATPAGDLLEMPDTAALADYVTAEEMAEHLREALARFASNPTRDVFVHFGFHQETADTYAWRVKEALLTVIADNDPNLVFETLSASAERALRLAKEIRQAPPTDPGLPLPTLREVPE